MSALLRGLFLLVFVPFSFLYADIGFVSSDGRRTWTFYADERVWLKECIPPAAVPSRMCTSTGVGLPGIPGSTESTPFQRLLAFRLRVETLLEQRREIDYLADQIRRIQARIDDASTGETLKAELRTTIARLREDHDRTLRIYLGSLALYGQNLTFYQRVMEGLRAPIPSGRAPWVIDAAERLSDYRLILPSTDTSVVEFLEKVYSDSGTYTLPPDLTPRVLKDTSYQSAFNIIPSRFERGASAVTGHTIPVHRLFPTYNSQVIYYGADSRALWQDTSRDFKMSIYPNSLAEVGAQTFLLGGYQRVDGNPIGAIRRIVGNGSDEAPSASITTVENTNVVHTFGRLNDRSYVALASNAAGNAVLLLLDDRGRLLERRVFGEDLARGRFAINAVNSVAVTSDGRIVLAIATTIDSYQCMVVTSISPNLRETQWTRTLCGGNLHYGPRTMASISDGGVVIVGTTAVPSVEHGREIPNPFALLLDREGKKIFEYRLAGRGIYDAVAFNPLTRKIAVVGWYCNSYGSNIGLIDLFDVVGTHLNYAFLKHRRTTDFYGVNAIPDQRSFMVAGTSGDDTPRSDEYAAAFTTVE